MRAFEKSMRKRMFELIGVGGRYRGLQTDKWGASYLHLLPDIIRTIISRRRRRWVVTNRSYGRVKSLVEKREGGISLER